MINEKLKMIISDLMYAKNEKDLKITLLRKLKDLTYENLTIENYEKIKESFKNIALLIDKE